MNTTPTLDALAGSLLQRLYRAENRRKLPVIRLMESPGLPVSETGAKDGFSPVSSGCIIRSTKNAEARWGDSSAIYAREAMFDTYGSISPLTA
jgi:hypothetical protein